MALSRDEYIANNDENVEKLVRKVMEGMDFDTMWQSAYQGLTNHYREVDHCFIAEKLVECSRKNPRNFPEIPRNFMEFPEFSNESQQI